MVNISRMKEYIPYLLNSMTLIMRLNEVCKTFIFTFNWSHTVLVQCWVEPFSARLVSLLRNNTYYFVKDELSRLGDGGAGKIFTDVSSGGKVSRKEHSVKVTHN